MPETRRDAAGSPLLPVGGGTCHMRPEDYCCLPHGTIMVSLTRLVGWLNVPFQVVRVTGPHAAAGHTQGFSPDRTGTLTAFWSMGFAVRAVLPRRPRVFHLVAPPAHPAHGKLDAFRIACETRYAALGRVGTDPGLMLDALGIERDHYYTTMEECGHARSPHRQII